MDEGMESYADEGIESYMGERMESYVDKGWRVMWIKDGELRG